MTQLFDLEGRCGIVTDSSRGIGQAIAQALASHGANVVISSRNQEACALVADSINSRVAGRTIAVAASIRVKADLERLVRAGCEALGEVNIAVCNAATNPYYGPMAGISSAGRYVTGQTIVIDGGATVTLGVL